MAPQGCSRAFLAVQSRLFLAGVVIPTVWVHGHLVSVWGIRVGPRPARVSHARALDVEETLKQLSWSPQLQLQGLGVKGGPHSRRGDVREFVSLEFGYPGCVCATCMGVGAGDARGTQGHRPVFPLFPRRAAGGGVSASLGAPPCCRL